jgi:hypothetical protein
MWDPFRGRGEHSGLLPIIDILGRKSGSCTDLFVRASAVKCAHPAFLSWLCGGPAQTDLSAAARTHPDLGQDSGRRDGGAGARSRPRLHQSSGEKKDHD